MSQQSWLTGEELPDRLAETAGVVADLGEAGTPLTTSEVADELDCGRRSAYDRLQDLADRDVVETKKVGARGRVWWRPPGRAAAGTAGADDGSADDRATAAGDRPDHRPDALDSLVGDVLREVDVGVFVVGPEFEVVWANEAIERYFGLEDETLVGRDKLELVESTIAEAVADSGAFAATVGSTYDDDYDDERFECRVTAGDGRRERWLEHRSKPIESGAYAGGRVELYYDVTERRERKRSLRAERAHLESEIDELFERIDDGFYALDEELRFTLVNDHACDLLGIDEESALGSDIEALLPLTESFRAALDEAIAEQEPVFVEDYYDPLDAWFDNAIYPSETGVSVYFRDVTERKEQERELRARVRQQQAVGELGRLALAEPELDALAAEAVESVAEVLDVEYCKLLELQPDDERLLLRAGVGWRDGLVGTATVGTDDRSQAGYTLLAAEPVVVEDFASETRFSGPDLLLDHDVTSGVSVIVGTPEEPWGILGAHDTDRREFSADEIAFLQSVATIVATASTRAEHEQELALYETIVEAIEDGVYVLDEEHCFSMVNDAYVEMTGYSREELLGSHCTLVVDESVSEESAERVAEIADGETAQSAAIEADVHRADGSTLRAESNFTAIQSSDADSPRKVGVARDVSERVERERELERKRRHLAALDDLNGVVREITEAVIERSTRDGIEAAVCERLADSDSYEFAWIGDVDAHSREVVLRTEAGVEGYLDDVTVSVDPADERSQGPAGRAIIEREMQVAHDVATDEGFDPWRDHVEAHEFRSSAAIPVVHEDTCYGVLNVYATRPGAFTGDEREVVGQLGEVVGHAIAAVDRKRALMGDEVVELEFRMADVFDVFGVPAVEEGRLTLDSAVPAGDDRYLVYGTATGEMFELCEALAETVPHWESVTRLDETDGVTRFEVPMVEPPVLSALASLGGQAEEVIIEDGDYYMRVHAPPSVGTRPIIDAVEEAYPMARLASKRQLSRADESVVTLDRLVQEELTDRQRGALEAAYHAGFFEWPRESSGEDVASSLGVAAPTFHQHVRNAQKRLLGAVLDD